jgi:hypothetical protein
VFAVAAGLFWHAFRNSESDSDSHTHAFNLLIATNVKVF